MPSIVNIHMVHYLYLSGEYILRACRSIVPLLSLKLPIQCSYSKNWTNRPYLLNPEKALA